MVSLSLFASAKDRICSLLGLPFSVKAIGFDLRFTRGSQGFGNFVIALPTIIGPSGVAGKLSFPISVLLNGSTFFGFISDPGTSFTQVQVKCQALDCLAIGGVAVENISVSSKKRYFDEEEESSSLLDLGAVSVSEIAPKSHEVLLGLGYAL